MWNNDIHIFEIIAVTNTDDRDIQTQYILQVSDIHVTLQDFDISLQVWSEDSHTKLYDLNSLDTVYLVYMPSKSHINLQNSVYLLRIYR